MNAHFVEFILKAACEAHDRFIEDYSHGTNCRTSEEMFSETDIPDPECSFCCVQAHIGQVVKDLQQLLEGIRRAGS